MRVSPRFELGNRGREIRDSPMFELGIRDSPRIELGHNRG